MTRKDSVHIVEVGPRDGLQNIKHTVPTHVKIDLIRRLARTGLRRIEATSFVSPRWVPQLSDAKQVMEAISPLAAQDDISFPVLVPNLKGLEAATSCKGLEEICVFVSASEGFSKKNINCSVDESLLRARIVVEKALEQGIRVRAYLSCIFECPYDGPTPAIRVRDVAKALLDMGCFEISLGDTVGTGTPSDVRRLLQVLLNAIPASKLAGHFHDTFGQATANVMTSYDMGLRTFDSSVSGLGGCPYSPGAKGNVATEDIVYAFNRMGVHTGIDMTELARTGEWIANQLGLPNGSRAGSALVAREKQALVIKQSHVQTEKHEEQRALRNATDEYLLHGLGNNIRIMVTRPKNSNGMDFGVLDNLASMVKQYQTVEPPSASC